VHVNKQEVGTLAFFQRSDLIRPAKRTRAFDRRPEVRRASIPSSGGVMNARSLARLYAMLASNGEWEGQRLLSEERLRQATAWVRRLPRSDILDPVARLASPIRGIASRSR
jgi:hypothetical protein